MADINQVQLPDGSQYNITDTTSGYATQSYVQSAISGITKATIGLGNVDNTSDANKPVSTAQQTALDGKTDTSVIAYTETSTTATKRYEIGDQFILNGVLYTAAAIIANGGTITVGTNCTASDTVIEQVESLEDSANINYDNTASGLTATKVKTAIDEVAGMTKHGLVEFWINANIGSSFAGQPISFTADVAKIDSFIISNELYKGETYGTRWTEIDKAVISAGTTVNIRELSLVTGDVVFVSRTVSGSISGNTVTLTFGDGKRGTTTDNDYVIPIKVLGLIHNN